MGTGGNLELAHGDAEALGGAQRLGVVAKAVLGLGDAHRQVAKAVLAQLGELTLGSRRKVNAVGAVDLGGDGLEGIGNIGAVLVGKLELARLLNQRMTSSARSSAPSPPLAQTSESLTLTPSFWHSDSMSSSSASVSVGKRLMATTQGRP